MFAVRSGTSSSYVGAVSTDRGSTKMVILGVILLVIGLLASIPVLTTIGAILIVVGLILNLVPIGGQRRLYY